MQFVARCCLGYFQENGSEEVGKALDGKRDKLHNLISVLLTNTTLCQGAARQAQQVL
jgi:hypothetical protein